MQSRNNKHCFRYRNIHLERKKTKESKTGTQKDVGGKDMKREKGHTLSLYEDSQQGVCGGDGLAKVLVIVDRKKVSVDISVSDHHLHVCDPVDGHNKTVEFLKLAWF